MSITENSLPTTHPVTSDLDTWFAQESFVERQMDNAAISAAHPNDTLVLAGPPRRTSDLSQMSVVGHLISLQYSGNAPVSPTPFIGSGRLAMLRGKGTVSGSMQRLILNGPNLCHRLYANMLAFNNGPIDPSILDEAASEEDGQIVLNLDSELFYLPFGLAVLIRNKARQHAFGGYIELCSINNWSAGISAGQSSIFESISFVADRIKPYGYSQGGPRKRVAANALTLETYSAALGMRSSTGA